MSMLVTQRRLTTLRAFRRIGGSNDGAVAIEYALIAALIAMAIIGVLLDLRDALIGLPLSSLIDAFKNALS